jgi:hypothetical protein
MLYIVLLVVFLVQFLVAMSALMLAVFLAHPEVPFLGDLALETPVRGGRHHCFPYPPNERLPLPVRMPRGH